KNTEISLISKFVDKQYLDNTSDEKRIIPSYYTQNVRLAYVLKGKDIKETQFILQGNNIFNKKYVANGYTYNYISGGEFTVENFYFPMAGINFMAAIIIKI